jgi:hypothetical protein
VLLAAPLQQLIDEFEALIVIGLEILGVQWNSDGIESVLSNAMNVRLGHEVLTPVVEELLRMSWSQQIREDELKFGLRLGETAETPEISFQHKPVAYADPADQERFAGAIHDLGGLRMHELRMGYRSSQQEQRGTKNQQALKKHRISPQN